MRKCNTDVQLRDQQRTVMNNTVNAGLGLIMAGLVMFVIVVDDDLRRRCCSFFSISCRIKA